MDLLETLPVFYLKFNNHGIEGEKKNHDKVSPNTSVGDVEEENALLHSGLTKCSRKILLPFFFLIYDISIQHYMI